MLNVAQQRMAKYRAAPKATIRSAPAPVGGWNTRDALDAMDPQDAVTLDNFFPTTGSVDLRKGSEEHASGVGAGDVETLMEYHAGGTRQLLAAGGGAIYNATSSGAATSIDSGYGSNRWQWVNFNGQLHAVNGADDPIMWNGSSVTTPSWSGSGLTVSTLDGIHVFKNRIFMWDSSTQDYWYAAIDSVTGTLTKFPLSRVGTFGGNLVAMQTWTLDAGDGVDDLAVFFMSSGEAIVYQGTDPGDADAWALVGIYRIAPLLGIRCAQKLAGDIICATKEDYLAFARVFKRDRTGADETKIAGAAKAAADAYASNFGWQVVHYPKGNMLIVNVPVQASSEYHQHVLNTLTGAWCRFTGMNARCWCVFNDNLYYGGGDGKVYRADVNYDDDGEVIEAEGQTAWNNFRSLQDKVITAVRPIMSADGTLNLSLGTQFDFKDIALPQETSSASEGSPWDTSEWDVAEWSPEATIRDGWHGASGRGHAVSMRMRVASKGQAIRWFRTDYLVKPGGNL